MTKKQKEEQERLEFLNKIANRKTEFTEEQIQMIKSFIFNILVNKTVMNRYEMSTYGDTLAMLRGEKNKTVNIYDCIEYMSNQIKK